MYTYGSINITNKHEIPNLQGSKTPRHNTLEKQIDHTVNFLSDKITKLIYQNKLCKHLKCGPTDAYYMNDI